MALDDVGLGLDGFCLVIAVGPVRMDPSLPLY